MLGDLRQFAFEFLDLAAVVTHLLVQTVPVGPRVAREFDSEVVEVVLVVAESRQQFALLAGNRAPAPCDFLHLGLHRRVVAGVR